MGRIVTRLCALWRDDSGVIALETTLVFPLQLMITMALLQVAHLFVTAQTLQYAAYQGARAAALEWHGDATSDGLEDAEDTAYRVAWVIVSPIYNSGAGVSSSAWRQLAVLPDRAYHYPPPQRDRLSYALTIRPVFGGDVAKSPETSFFGTAEYWTFLGVPVGGAMIHQVVAWADSGAVRRDSDGLRQMRMRQNAYFARIWPR